MKQLALPLLLVAGLTACAGGHEAQLSPTGTTTTSPAAQATAELESSPTGVPVSPTAVASMTAQERAATEAVLRAASVRPEDLPGGLKLDKEKFTTNEDLAQEESEYTRNPVEDPEGLGRILGYEAEYSRLVAGIVGGTVSATVATELYQEPMGALEYLEFICQWWSDPDLVQPYLQERGAGLADVSEVEIFPVSLTDSGDEDGRCAFEVHLTMHLYAGDAEFHTVVHVLAVRRGRALSAIRVTSFVPAPSAGQLEHLARTLDERMEDALE